MSKLMTRQQLLLPPPPKPWKPHKYQQEAVKFLLARQAAALFLDPGLGKTSIVLKALQALKKQDPGTAAVVLCPLRVAYSVWDSSHPYSEVNKWKDFCGLKVVVLHGKDKDQLINETADIYVLNFDGVNWFTSKNYLAKLIRRHTKLTLVIDELSKLKHTRTDRFRKLKPLLPKFTRRWGLTGSPVANGLLGLFGQVYVLDLGKALGKYITHYRNRYFSQEGFSGFVWVPRPGALKEINTALAPLALRMNAEDYLDLPDLIEQDVWVELPPKVRKIYTAMENDLLVKIDEGAITAANAGVASGKCRQIANGSVYGNDGEITHLHDEKTKALMEIVDELQGQPLLISYEYRSDLDRLKKALGKDLPVVGSHISPKRNLELEALWNAGQLPFLVGHPAAMGHGLNLQESGSHLCCYSPTWDFDLYDQLYRRLWRQGNKSKQVIIYRIVARDTIDEVICRMLASKDKTQRKFFDGLKALRQRRNTT